MKTMINKALDLVHDIFKIAEVKVATTTAIIGGAVEVVAETSAHGTLYGDLEWFVLICKIIVYGFGAIGVLRGFFKWAKKN